MRLFPILLTVFIDSLGFGLVYPIFSVLLMNPEQGFLPLNTSLALRGWLFGLLVSGFCLGQFFGGPILGTLSDYKGRKKILLLTLWLAASTYALTVFGIIFESIVVIFISRLLGGVAAGNWSVAQTIIVDTSTEEEKTKNFGLLGMAWGTGFVIGPYLGGKLSDPSICAIFNLTTPFWAASVLCLLNIALLLWKMQESLPAIQFTKISLVAGIHQLKEAFTSVKLRSLFFMMFIFCIGWGFFTEFCPVFLIREFHFSGSEIANFYASIGFWIAFCQGLVIRPFLKWFSPNSLILTALLGMGCTLIIMVFIKVKFFLYCMLPALAFFEALLFPSATTIVSNVSDKQSQGHILGIYNSVQWAAIGLTPLFSGSFVAIYPYLPFVVGAMAMFFALIVFIANNRPKELIY
ncbi:Tetracycline resistance protein [Candidatus Rhabdochlamydia oedothoracis]|uniref:Tetracycline resistance protein n=1 Tax=Candidatus Rhabdochlamydia oedothoracis TaxID=2720720 RepID=A0ABX8V1Z3_9BACT|nr:MULTISPECIES: MFS transporter [Rhabdochlamydia]KAG6559113.1 Tetracycline resistance protein, class C [Candidatus Rhabdochlamydia sp. W815]MCL6756238.1 MFS transporter [Candidatus Rhabdochlamydia oedothoracis]QYF49166.1 Tetracycline resistance protein [Candidatus Rhabdochlamydia oedothoracis]